MENIFAAFSHEDSLVFLLSVLITFLIGFVTAWILYGGRAARNRREAENWKKSYDELVVEHASLKEKLDLKEADLVRARRETEDALVKVGLFDAEKAKWMGDLNAATEQTAKLQIDLHAYAATVEDLNNQILGLKARNAQLSKEAEKEGDALQQLSQMQSAFQASVSKLNSLDEKIGLMAEENAALRASTEMANQLADVQNSYTEAAGRMALLESRLAEMDKENEALEAEIERLKQANVVEVPTAISLVADTAVSGEVEEEEEGDTPTNDARGEVLAAIGTKIPSATEADKDDLTKIKGIGTFIEQKLNEIGIWNYAQIAAFDDGFVEKITSAIEFFPGRIHRDNWVGQAAHLAQLKKDAEAPTSPSVVFPKNPQDLKIVEGIGPKIENLLKKAGINNLQDLSATTEERLKEVLHGAGDSYRIHDPATWPIQADLAAKGEWEKLKEYQDFLVGGRSK